MLKAVGSILYLLFLYKSEKYYTEYFYFYHFKTKRKKGTLRNFKSGIVSCAGALKITPS